MSHVCRILLLVFLHGVACTSIYEEAQQLLPYLRETRRALHQIPELVFELDKTSVTQQLITETLPLQEAAGCHRH